MQRLLLLILTLFVPFAMMGCPSTADDDDTATDDDDATGADDDDTVDDDDTADDDDTVDDDDASPDDDDATGDDDDHTGDDDDHTGDDDDATGDDDDSTGDDDDATGDDDDHTGDDDDSTGDDDDSAAACISDPYEPNDELGAAFGVLAGTYSDPHACPGDDDWYAISLTNGASLDVSAVFTHTEGNLDLELYNDAGALLADSLSTSDDEALSYTASADASVYVRAFLSVDLGGQVGVPYSLELSATNLGCASDSFEPNDNLGQAQTLSTGPTPGLSACGDEDWYSVSLNAAESMTLTTAFQHAEGNIDVHLVDAGGNVFQSADSLNDNESLVYTAATAEQIYVQVVLTTDLGSTPGNVYGMDLVVGTAACAPDSFEPNDDAGTAAQITAGTLSALSACPGNDDWYSFNVAAGQTVDINAAFANAEGNINLTLRDGGGGILDSASSADDDEVLSYLATAPDLLLLQVELFADAGSLPGNSYDLTLGLSAPVCASDTFESNDDMNGAAIVTATTYSSLSACETDDDWYTISLLSGETIGFDVIFSALEGNIDMELIDSTGAIIDSSTSSSDSESIGYTAGSDESVWLRVFLVSDSGSIPGSTYELEVTGVPPSCTPDASEPNDDSTQAPTLPAGTFNGLTICPSDTDWYALDLTAGDVLTVDLLFDHDEGDLSIELFDSTLTSLTAANSTDDNEQVSTTIGSTGIHYIQVNIDPDQGPVPGNSYSLDISVVGLSCPTDAFEPNDGEASPSAITVGTHTGLSACDSDDDYYSIDLTAGDIFTVEVLFSNVDGDIDLELLDIGGASLEVADSTDDNESISYTITSTATYLVRVSLFSDSGAPGNDYTMLLSTAASTCLPDNLEPNDDTTLATLGAEGSYTSLTACDSDDDLFVFTLTAGVTLDVQAFFSDAEGDIDVYLYDDGLTELASGVTINDDEAVSHTATYSGLHYLAVTLAVDDGALPGNSYDLQIDIPDVPCPFDIAEPNDAEPDAATLSPDGLADLAVCPTDSDWFILYPTPGDVITLDLFFDAIEGDLDANLYEVAVSPILVDSGTSTDSNEQLNYTAVTDAQLLLEVYLAVDAGQIDGTPYEIEVTGLSEVCIPDSLEYDGELAVATTAVDEDVFTGLSACPADEDWFAIDLLDGEEFQASATFLHAEGDIDLNLMDPTLTFVQNAVSTDDDETLVWATSADGTYYVIVTLASDSGLEPGNSYDLGFEVVSTVCEPDALEPNETIQTPTTLTPGDYVDLTACGEPDIYEIALGTGETLEVDLTFLHAEGDIDMTFMDDGAAVQETATSTDDDENLIFNSTAAGNYYLEVMLVNDLGSDAGNDYDLSFTVDTINCTADAFEPNDSSGSPVSLNQGPTIDLVACPTDDDWFNFSVTAGEVIDLLAQFDIADGDLDLVLLDPTGSEVATATATSSNEALVHTATQTGDYVVGVEFASEGAPPDGVEYDLNLSVASESCFFDWAEDNDDAGSPTAISSGSNPHLVVCETDDDWFAFELPDGQILDLALVFSHAEGDVDFVLYDSTFTEVSTGTSTTDNEELLYEPPPTTGGTHYLEVLLITDSGSITGNPYSVDFSYADITGCPVDDLEENDDVLSAGFLGLGSYPDQSVCETDEDWFGMAVAAGDTINIDLTFLHADGDIDITLYDDQFSVVDQGISTDDNESVSYTASATGGMVVQITMPADDVSGGGNTYDMEVYGSTASCTADSFEEDDSQGDAAPLPLGTTALRACPSDPDWSLVLLDAGETATWTASFADADGDIDLYLYDASGTELDSADSITDDETLSFTASTFGYYFVETSLVVDFGDPGNTYTMDLSIN